MATTGPSVGSGRVYAGSDFVGGFTDGVWGTGIVALGDTISLTSVNEGALAATLDESGGVLSITTDTGDDDNAAIFCHGGAPRDGKMVMRARFKLNNLTTLSAVYVGFAETISATTPVMPAEFATATMTYNSGGCVGFNFDIDGTTDDFRAVMGDGSAAISDSANGTRVNATLTVDRWFEAEVILNEDGSAECWFGDVGHQNSDGTQNRLRLIKRFTAGTLLTPADVFHAVLMVENRTAGAVIMEVDYFYAEFGRDWRAT